MNAVPVGLGPTLGLLYASTFWGVVWYPTRLLEQAGIAGAWLTLVGYAAALLVFLPFVRLSVADLRRRPVDLAVLTLAAGWTNLAFVLAVLEGEVVRVILLFYLSPVWTVLLGRWLLGEPLTRRTALMLAPGLAGAVIMLWDPAIGRVPLNRADLLALSAGFAFALNNVMVRRIEHIGVRAKTGLAWFGVVLVSMPFALLGSGVPDVPAAAWIGALMLGVCGFMFSTLAVVYGVSNMPVQRSAVIMLFELIVGAATAWWLAGELVEPRDWIGGILIVSAAMLAVFQREERRTA
jgi:drug/metabolite transporter (DMT)-like permease